MAAKVLTYHKINPAEFREQAGYLKSHGDVLITFDDGLINFPHEIVREFNLPVTLFINPGLLGEGDRMSASEVIKLSELGVTIANHGWSHRPFANLSESEIKSEYERARDWISENIKVNAAPEILALPRGSESPHTRAQLGTLGIKLIYGAERVDVYPGRSLNYFKLSLNPIFQWLRRKKSRVIKLFSYD
ncbi:MAG TPA: polysaccharide deacetylase family protein [Candidatus Paceibacterota bacterium]